MLFRSIAEGEKLSVPRVTQATPAPTPPSKGKDSVQDGETASLTPSSPSKEKGDLPVDSSYQAANPKKPLTSAPAGFLEGFDLSGIEENTLTADF